MPNSTSEHPYFDGTTGITVASKGLVSPQSIFVDINTEDMYIMDLDQKQIRSPVNSLSYRVHLWKKNEKVGRILFREAGEYLFGRYFHHLTLDKEMNIYVGTRYFIKKWLASTNYTAKVIVAGKNHFNLNGSTDLSDPVAFYVTDDLTLYIADWNNKRIQRWEVNATNGTTVIGNLTYVTGITMDCNGYLYYAEMYDSTIYQLNMMTNQSQMIVRNEDNLGKLIYYWPSAIKIDKFGNIFAMGNDQMRVAFDDEYPLIDPIPNVSLSPPPPPPPVQRKKRILIGYLIVTLLTILLIISITLLLSIKLSTKYDTTTTTTTTTIMLAQSFTTTRETSTFSPIPCTIPSANATWIRTAIVFINPFSACSSNKILLCNPRDLFIDNIHDTLYIADTNNNRIQKYLLTGIDHSKMISTGITVASKGLVLPQSIFVNVYTEDMYILDFDQIEDFDKGNSASYRVHLWKKNDNVGRILFREAGEYSFGQYFHHLTLDKEMNIYVGTRFFIKKWLASTNYTKRIVVAGKNTYDPTQSTDIYDPLTFFVTSDLTLYISDWKNKRIQKWTVNATEGTIVIGNVPQVLGITMDCNGYLYYAESNNNTISQINMVTNETRIIASFENAFGKSSIHLPIAIQVDRFGNIFLLDVDHVNKFSIVQK
ncbi:hypothetical protein I4U23_016604 [Adineta vaga]|nr:hypothetical protein I4U23_016604 [Adineta vaga]